MKKVLKENSHSFLQLTGSKFYGYGFEIHSEKEVEIIVQKLWKNNKKAVHICYGFICYQNNLLVEKFNDDYEPKNTAGKKILLALQNNNFINSLIVVVRYKSKTLLGTGLLARSYYKVSELLVKNENHYQEYVEMEKLIILVKNSHEINSLINFLKYNKIKILSKSVLQITICVPKKLSIKIKTELRMNNFCLA